VAKKRGGPAAGDGAGAGGPGHYPYVGDVPEAVRTVAASLAEQAAAMQGVDQSLGALVPRVRASWREGVAGDTAYAAVSKVLEFTPTVAPSLSVVSSVLAELAGDLTAARLRIDELCAAYGTLEPAERRVVAFGDWIPPARESAYDRALSEMEVVAALVGFRTVADIDAEYARVVRTVTSQAEAAGDRIAAQTSAQALPGGRAGSSAFAAGMPGGTDLTATVDSLVARGLLPPECRDMDSATLLDWLKHHPDVARALVENRPGPGGSPAEDFLYSLTQPALYPAGADISGIDRDRVRTFFETMSPEDQKLLGALFPGVVGDLSGAPFDARDSGNYVRIVVAKEDEAAHIAALRDQLAQLSSINDPRVGSTEAAQDAIREQLALAEGRLGLYQGVLDHPERQIVLFDAAKGAFAEVSGVIGPSTKNIGVVVPGTGTNMAGIQGNVTAYSAFVEHAPPGELAMITWMGGGLPQSIFPDAFLDSSSRDLGPLLAEFSRDVRQEGAYAGAATPPQLTVAGHSYGGAVVGIAETYGVDADRILHVESPGMGNDVNSTADYHPLNPDVRRYAMTAPGDPIALAQGKDAWGFGHGPAPDTATGFTRLATGSYEDGTVVAGVDAHGGVFTPRSDSWENMYQVFTGGTVLVCPPDVQVGTPDGYYVTQPSSDPPTPEDIP
jgi:hypothetical protein